MRQVREASRTGVRMSRPKSGKAASRSPRHAGKRRGAKRQGAIAAWFDRMREKEFGARPISICLGVLIVGATGYGLMVGGHVSDAVNSVRQQTNELLAHSGFSIQNVTVTGRGQTRKDELLAAVGITRGDPIFGFDTENARQRIERLDWVQAATVTRLLPDTIRIEIEEREPFALWQRGGQLSLVDRQGSPITDEGVQDFAHLPFIVGFGAPRAAPELLAMMERERPELLQRVRAFVRVSDRRWNLRLENGVDVKLPETGVERALNDLAIYDTKYKILSRDIVAVDLRLPDRVSVELSETAANGAGGATDATFRKSVIRSGRTGHGGNT